MADRGNKQGKDLNSLNSNDKSSESEQQVDFPLNSLNQSVIRSMLNSSQAENESNDYVEIPLKEIWTPQMKLNLELNYQMNHSKRGKAIIFNHYMFSIPGMDPRRGTDYDQDMFVQVLLNWGFKRSDIIIKWDLKMAAIMDHLYELAKHIDHTNYDMFVCAVFTHGERNTLYAMDQLYPTSNLWKYFTNEGCPTLKNKPKLFFIQACRGTKLDGGVYAKDPRKHLEPTTNSITIPTIEVVSPDSPDEVLVVSANSKSLIKAIANSEGIDTSPEIDTEVDISTTPNLSRRSSGGSIQGIPSSWQETRRKSADEPLPYVKEKSLFHILTQNKRIRTQSETIEEQIMPLTKLNLGRRRSTPVNKIPSDWLESQGETMDSKCIYIEEPFQAPHSEPDILVAFSTADGHYSFRRPTHGSWFINVLYDVVKSIFKWDEVSLLDLLTDVNLRVAVDMESYVTDPRKKIYDQKKQISCFHSTLTKRVYFTKKISKRL